jgi:hypothetical protein
MRPGTAVLDPPFKIPASYRERQGVSPPSSQSALLHSEPPHSFLIHTQGNNGNGLRRIRCPLAPHLQRGESCHIISSSGTEILTLGNSQTQDEAWFKPSEENIQAGVCLRVDTGSFRVFPYENRHLEPFEAAVRALNPVVAVKNRSAAIHAAMASV